MNPLLANWGWRFDSHQAVFDRQPQEQQAKQDRLWRFDLPSTERVKVLSALSDYNLNAFSLFGSEESLLEILGSTSMCCEGAN
jgi:hypothetical protein